MWIEVISNHIITQYDENDAKEHSNDAEYIKTAYERLSLVASIQEYLLNAVIYPNGNCMSFYGEHSARKSTIDSLSKTYETIHYYVPEYVAPALPSEDGVNTISRSYSNSSNNGCAGPVVKIIIGLIVIAIVIAAIISGFM